MPLEAIDAAARKVIVDAGYGPGFKYFTHRLGHGMGMDGHEWPYLVKNNMFGWEKALTLQPGMMFSDEPGIYIRGEFGVRLEDDMHITENGAELFTPQSPSIEEPFRSRSTFCVQTLRSSRRKAQGESGGDFSATLATERGDDGPGRLTARFALTRLPSTDAGLAVPSQRVPPRWAEAATSVDADRVHVQGRVDAHGADRTRYALHEIRSASGTMIREYVNSSGTVFAVAWDGPWLPDLRQVLGDHFDRYQASDATQARGCPHRARRAGHRRGRDLVVQMSGHPRAFTGRAYLPGAAAGGRPARSRSGDAAMIRPLLALLFCVIAVASRRSAATRRRRRRTAGRRRLLNFQSIVVNAGTGEQLLQRRVYVGDHLRARQVVVPDD